MKINIISDIHEDINRCKGYDYSSLLDAEFVVIAGDISGSPIATTNWITKNIKRGIFVEGNHLGYTECNIEELDYKEGANKYLSYTFDGTDGVKFLENDTYEVDDILFIGCTLYTDFNLYGTPVMSMRLAREGMNDFNYVYCDQDGRRVKLYPDKTAQWHEQSVKFIDETCENNKDKKIVVVTHHCPNEESLSIEYANSMLNPAYASDLEWIMEKHDNLKLWVCGHVHNDSDFIVYGTRVLSHPFGYYNELNRDMTKIGNDRNSLALTIDTGTL